MYTRLPPRRSPKHNTLYTNHNTSPKRNRTKDAEFLNHYHDQPTTNRYNQYDAIIRPNQSSPKRL